LTAVLEQRFPIGGGCGEARIVKIDDNVLAGDVEAGALPIQWHIRGRSAIAGPEQVLSRFEAEHRSRVEGPGFRVLGEENRTDGGRGDELFRRNLHEVGDVRRPVANPDAGVIPSVQRDKIHIASFLLHAAADRSPQLSH
jgi:hypothetical protein